ncbi:MAG: hypothetical protein K9G64_07555 [Bacteroidia bacterium]|nr:hypothetical protein [Bacteroidia bacterium]
MKFIITLITFFIFSSCIDEEKKCIEIKQAAITSTLTPAIGLSNTIIPIVIKFGINSGCGKYYSTEETSLGNTRTIKVNAIYEGCVCTAIAGTIATTYNFKANNIGTYILNFSGYNNTFITDTIVIQ